MVKIMIADDQQLIRESLKIILNSDPNFEVVKVVGSGQEVLDTLETESIDIILMDVRMPSMILQPVVENAVNHGIRDIEWEGKIHLTVTGDADYIRISVKDNGKGMTQEQIEGVLSGNREHRNEEGDSTGIGMNNVISRLELYYEESGLMEINSEGEGKGTEAVIYIPVHEN